MRLIDYTQLRRSRSTSTGSGSSRRCASGRPATAWRGSTRASSSRCRRSRAADRRVWRYAFIYPNTAIDLYPDQVTTWQIMPGRRRRDRRLVRLLPPARRRAAHAPGAAAQPALQRARAREDVDLVDNVQRGLASTGYRCGPLAAREAAVAWLAERVRRDLRPMSAAAGPRRRRPGAAGARREPRAPASGSSPRRSSGSRATASTSVRIARIAMDAGVSSALVHYHFATREALLAEALEYSYGAVGDARTAVGAPAALRTPSASRGWSTSACRATRSSSATGCCGSSCGCAPSATPSCGRSPRSSTRACATGSRRRSGAGVADGEFARCDPEEVADRALALIDGFGIRTLIGDGARAARARTPRGRRGARARPRARRAAARSTDVRRGVDRRPPRGGSFLTGRSV